MANVNVGAVVDWVRKNEALLEPHKTLLRVFRGKAEQSEQFEWMRHCDDMVHALEALQIVSGVKQTEDSILIGLTHPIERRAMRHIRLEDGAHWVWEGSHSTDGVPVMSVPKGWPAPGVPHYDVSTGMMTVDDSYAPAERLSKSNHTTMAVYRALWYIRFCNPKSPNYDPTLTLRPRQKLAAICGATSCVNPGHFQRLTTTTARYSPSAQARAMMPPYATPAALQALDARLAAQPAQPANTALGATLYCTGRVKHVRLFHPVTALPVRCVECQRLNNEARQKRKALAAAAYKQQVYEEVGPNLFDLRTRVNPDGSVDRFTEDGTLILPPELEATRPTGAQIAAQITAAALARAAAAITLPEDVHRPQGETPTPHTGVVATPTPPPLKSREELREGFAAALAMFEDYPPTDSADAP